MISWLFFGCGSQVEISEELAAQLPEIVDFNYHVKPILSDRCFACHGPDKQKLEADLRLDDPDEAFKALGENRDRYALVPDKPFKSELFKRITSEDPAYQMPPPESNLALSELEIAILSRWIEQGAEYKEHWSFIPPKKVHPPSEEDDPWIVNDIDRFVLAKLEAKDLSPSPRAQKTRLLRRVHFDLTGLPPTLAEVDAFLDDTSSTAYEDVVDKLLASPHYGERMAMDWLDVARYADSHGYHADGIRTMWPWRDWVIAAFNENMSIDQFITWQIAGDLLPDATQEQVLATAFHRNNPTNSESGIVPEEYRLENVFDRTNTTAKVFLGLTMECARCHDHKFDPISQKEFYQFTTFFNNVDELGMTGNDGNFAPTLPLMSEHTRQQLKELRGMIEVEEKALTSRKSSLLAQNGKLNSSIKKVHLSRGLVGSYPLDYVSPAGQVVNRSNQQPGVVRGCKTVPGFKGKALRFTNEYEHLTLEGIGDWERTESFSMGAYVYPEQCEAYSVIMGNAGGKNNHWRGYEVYLDSINRISVRLTNELPSQCLQVVTKDSIPIHDWTHVFFSYDGSSKARGIEVYINGIQSDTEVLYDDLFKSIRTISTTLKLEARGIRVGRSFQGDLDLGLFQGAIDEISVYNRQLSSFEVLALAGRTAKNMSNAQMQALEIEHYVLNHDPPTAEVRSKLDQLRMQEHRMLDTLIDVMVMREMHPPRKTFVLDRGMYDSPTEQVLPGTPKQLLKWNDDWPQNRLGLTKWILSDQHPLTTRVLTNRYWHILFGTGLVNTLEDFGNQGSLPSHPNLLDWLAVTFRESGWDLKFMLKKMVMSATYCQSSLARKELLELDASNKFLTRGPSYRLPAEMIRDNMLQASGLLVDKIGGPSVKTYQPEGLWSKTHFSQILTEYQPDSGDKLYRRSMYTFIRRTAPPPTMTVLDASDRSMCIVRRQKTNTPLQALLLLNEPQMIECSRVLAERVMLTSSSVKDQLQLAFRLLSSRRLIPTEMDLMYELFGEELQKYDRDKAAAYDLLNIGEYPRDEELDPIHVAALTMVTNTMANFDEVYTKR
ncbi:MAG: DUF1549 domain-containing protein [Saprospiraceae bacterium]|nr:DUF1549 domain-containing protein [Saprospiraceae bacterium]